jgi:hypothetical protein
MPRVRRTWLQASGSAVQVRCPIDNEMDDPPGLRSHPIEEGAPLDRNGSPSRAAHSTRVSAEGSEILTDLEAWPPPDGLVSRGFSTRRISEQPRSTGNRHPRPQPPRTELEQSRQPCDSSSNCNRCSLASLRPRSARSGAPASTPASSCPQAPCSGATRPHQIAVRAGKSRGPRPPVLSPSDSEAPHQPANVYRRILPGLSGGPPSTAVRRS